MLNQAWLQIYTKWFIINTLQPLISYYSDKLHLTITEEMKVRFMTLEPIAKDGECLKSELGENKSLHLYLMTGEKKCDLRSTFVLRCCWLCSEAVKFQMGQNGKRVYRVT